MAPRYRIVQLSTCVCGNPDCEIPHGLCHCGCGEKTWIATVTDRKAQYFCGNPVRFVGGHQRRIRPQIEIAEPFKIDGDYCRVIPLPQGFVAIVDEVDYVPLMTWKWQIKVTIYGIYAVRQDGGKYSRRHIYMHRQLLEVPAGFTVDHKNINTLDNRRRNLRPATAHNQVANRNSRRSRWQYKGVRPNGNKFTARIRVNHKDIHLGSYSTVIDAASAYDRAAIRYFGEFARTNFPISDYNLTEHDSTEPADEVHQRGSGSLGPSPVRCEEEAAESSGG